MVQDRTTLLADDKNQLKGDRPLNQRLRPERHVFLGKGLRLVIALLSRLLKGQLALESDRNVDSPSRRKSSKLLQRHLFQHWQDVKEECLVLTLVK
jgi:hypothetical protein